GGLKGFEMLGGEEDERDPLDSRLPLELRAGRGERDLGGRLDGIAVDPRRDRRERDGAAPEPGCDFERAAMARRQELGLALIAATPDRADRVDHVPRRQVASGRRLCLSGLAAAEEPRLGEDRRPARTMDRPVDAASAE